MKLKWIVLLLLLTGVYSCQFKIPSLINKPVGSELNSGIGENSLSPARIQCHQGARNAILESPFFKTLKVKKPTRLEGQDFRRLNAQHYEALKQYTGAKSGEINELCTIPNHELGWTFDRYQEIKGYCRDLDAAYRLLPKSPGTVFRGVGQVSHADLKELETNFKRGSFIGLGPKNLRQWTSTSTNPIESYRFANCSEFSNQNSNKIIFVINQFSGVAIEEISEFPNEFEVLLSPHALFLIRGIHKLFTCDNWYVIEVDEVQRPMDPRPGVRPPQLPQNAN